MKKIFYISPLVLQTSIWIPTRVFMRLFCSYEIKGLDNLKVLKSKKTGVIFTPNHSSELDPIMVPAALPFLSGLMPMFYVSREQKFYNQSGWRQYLYGGLFFNLWGAHTVYVSQEDYDKKLVHHIELLNDKKSVCIFPEGRKTRDGQIGEGKPGASFLTFKTGSALVPMNIKGLYKDDNEKDFLGRKKITITFGKPLFVKDFFENSDNFTIDDIKKFRDIFMDEIKKLAVADASM